MFWSCGLLRVLDFCPLVCKHVFVYDAVCFPMRKLKVFVYFVCFGAPGVLILDLLHLSRLGVRSTSGLAGSKFRSEMRGFSLPKTMQSVKL